MQTSMYGGLPNTIEPRPTRDPSLILAVIWNLSKRADNASGLVQPELFDLLFSLLCGDDEEDDVLRRIVSCIQNLASMRRYLVGLLLVGMSEALKTLTMRVIAIWLETV